MSNAILEVGKLVNGQGVSVVALVASSEIRSFTNKTGAVSTFGSYSFRGLDSVIAGVQWGVAEVFPVGTIVSIEGKRGEYNGQAQLVVDKLSVAEGVDYIDFVDMERPKALWHSFKDFCKENLSDSANAIVGVLFQNIPYKEFITAFCAVKFHDAFAGGLVAHTLKMLKLAKVIIENEPLLNGEGLGEEDEAVLEAEMLYLGIILHDIGKIKEYTTYGAKDDDCIVSHIVCGLEVLFGLKEKVVESYGERGYMLLQSIIEGHHGKEFGAPPTTVLSQVAHLIDYLESQVTGMYDAIRGYEEVPVSIRFDGMKLYV